MVEGAYLSGGQVIFKITPKNSRSKGFSPENKITDIFIQLSHFRIPKRILGSLFICNVTVVNVNRQSLSMILFSLLGFRYSSFQAKKVLEQWVE